MKKCLLLIALVIVSQLNNAFAQSIINAPDIVCINQPVHLSANVKASSYYWSFCSAYLQNTAPTGNNIGATFGFNNPSAIDVVRDSDGLYYGFVLNSASNEFLKLNYGNDLDNVPTVTNLGSLSDVLPAFPTSLYVIRDSAAGEWFVFVAGGANVASSSLGRIDFGHSLSNNKPNIVNFGNYSNELNAPVGLFVAKEGDQWFGYCVNNGDGSLIRMQFEKNISNTPLLYNVGDLGGKIVAPSDMAAIKLDDNWYFFIVSATNNNSMTRVDFGNTLTNIYPVGNVVGSFAGNFINPSSITISRDCGGMYLYVVNQGDNSLTRINLPFITGPYTDVTRFANPAGMNGPSAISSLLRQKGNVYGYVANSDNSLSKVIFPQCTNSTAPISFSPTPPPYIYNTPGTYNLFLVINDGQPDMYTECKTITVLPYPPLLITPSDTLRCMNGDSSVITVQTFDQDSITWSPNYAITSPYGPRVVVNPPHSTLYTATIYYANGCIVKATADIRISKVVADAGPYRTIGDGASTIIGGPYTSIGPEFSYNWFPTQYMNDFTSPNPIVNPAHDFTYYLEVTEHDDDLGCSAIDTVVVRVGCNDFNVPNAFIPGNGLDGTNKFGILNREIVKLNFFRVFDRWGKMVFETNDITEKWDGNVNGKPAEAGVFVWEADGFCGEGKRISKSGNVTLLR